MRRRLKIHGVAQSLDFQVAASPVHFRRAGNQAQDESKRIRMIMIDALSKARLDHRSARVVLRYGYQRLAQTDTLVYQLIELFAVRTALGVEGGPFATIMPSTRQNITFRKRNLRNGALLAVSEAVKLVNIPLAQDVARHVRQIAVALKVPKTNDSSAQNLAKHVEGLLGVLNMAVRYLDHSEAPSSDADEDMLVELHQLHTHLSDTHTKLVSQTEFREDILKLKEELPRTIVDLTLRLLIVMLASGAQNQLVIAHRFNTVSHEHNALSREHNTLARKHVSLARKHTALVHVTQRRQRISDKRIRGLTHKVNAVLLMRRTDEPLSSVASVDDSNRPARQRI
ncbi:hypothetical protein B0J17DRAFT_755985 [Rhizoctonia solani]|nr:hypothetical protein B0J17DRAFT_755985 [Rhizoctonia solani]